MLVEFQDAELGSKIYVNPLQVAVVFEGKNPEGVQLTMINLLNGNVATTEPIEYVITKLQAQYKE